MPKPSLKSPCVADRYAGPGERIAEFSFPAAASGGGDLPGGLISLRYGNHGRRPLVTLYRVEGCDVGAPLSDIEQAARRLVACCNKDAAGDWHTGDRLDEFNACMDAIAAAYKARS